MQNNKYVIMFQEPLLSLAGIQLWKSLEYW